MARSLLRRAFLLLQLLALLLQLGVGLGDFLELALLLLDHYFLLRDHCLQAT